LIEEPRHLPAKDLLSPAWQFAEQAIRATAAERKVRAIQTILGAVASFTVATISGGGYLGIAGLMAIESACIPLPSEIIMPFAGYLASTGRFSLPLVATAGAIGCNLGSVIAYEIGARGGRRAVERWGTWVLLGRNELDRMQRYFTRFGSITVLVCRLLALVRTFIALPSGIARMPRLRFHIYTFAGSWPWCFGLAYVGLKLGQRWDSDPRLRAVMHQLDGLVVAALLIGIGWFVWHRWRHRVGRQE
jgi:membrane protein DedA with SNARE-associated domain